MEIFQIKQFIVFLSLETVAGTDEMPVSFCPKPILFS